MAVQALTWVVPKSRQGVGKTHATFDIAGDGNYDVVLPALGGRSLSIGIEYTSGNFDVQATLDTNDAIVGETAAYVDVEQMTDIVASANYSISDQPISGLRFVGTLTAAATIKLMY